MNWEVLKFSKQECQQEFVDFIRKERKKKDLGVMKSMSQVFLKIPFGPLDTKYLSLGPVYLS